MSAYEIVRMSQHDSANDGDNNEFHMNLATLEGLIDAAKVGSWEWWPVSNRVRFSSSFGTAFGMSPEDFDGYHGRSWKTVHPEDRARVKRAYVRLLKGEAPLRNLLFRIRNKRGEWFWSEETAQVVERDADGNVVRVAGISGNVTAFKEMEAALRKRNADYLKARKAAEAASQAKSDFLAVMSHEIRTPLNAILGAYEVLDGASFNTEQRQYLQLAREAGQTLQSLINGILDFTKIESGNMECDIVEFEPLDLVHSVIDIMKAQAWNSGLELSSYFDLDVPVTMRGDAGKVRQILLNLVSNAIKFTEEGGVQIACSTFGEDAIRFEISDSGIGISAKEVERLFGAFVQADASTTRRYGGTGLGLTVSRRLAELMGGTLTVESEPGIGSRFTLLLPLGDESGPILAERISRQRGVAILAEANPVTRETLSHQLERLGLSVIHAEPLEERCSLQVQTLAGEIRAFKLINLLDPDESNESALRKPISFCALNAALAGEPAMPGPSAQDDQGDTAHSGKLLVVDDSLANQMIVKAMLEKAGYEVVVAGDGEAALGMVLHNRFRAVLMDLSMPVMDGFEATRSIRELPGPAGQVPILALTANAFKDDLERCYACGMQGVLTKPIDRKRMLRMLTQYQSGAPANNTLWLSSCLGSS